MPAAFEPGQPSEPVSLFTGAPAATAALPPGVVEKLEMIREHADAAHRQLPLAEERIEANTARGDAQRRLDRLLAHPHDNNGGVGGGFALRRDDPRVLAQEKLLAELTTAAQRLDDRYRRAIELWQPRARTRGDCEAWLKNLPGGTSVADWVGLEPRLSKGEDLLGAVSRLERRTRELAADLHRVSSAPYPLSHARSRLVEIIERLAQPPNVSMLIEHEHGEIAWPMRSLQSTVLNASTEAGRPIAFTETPDVLATLAWAMKDTLIKQLDTLLTAEADDGAALSITERQTQAAQIAGDLLATERDLSWLVWAGLSRGLPVWFGDISAPAILAAQLATMPEGNRPSGSSPGMSWDVIGR